MDFEKNAGVALKFVAAKNHDIYVHAHSLVENVAKGRVIYKKTDEQILLLFTFPGSSFTDNK
ncbi:hypothetical protein AXP45_23090 [Salmonella enterica subsp. enterica]|nr:hypothetical protein [Salmonella enterica subsp. enterica]EBQ0489715.1 hypothetical protein [Salmonella enterica subsp. enterica]